MVIKKEAFAMNEQVGTRLKSLRIKKGYTQEYVGNIVGTSKQTLYKYERGIVTNIPPDKIEALAKLYDVQPGHIMGWAESHSPTYYTPPETIQLAEELKNNPHIHTLLRASKNLSPDDMKQVINFVEFIKSQNSVNRLTISEAAPTRPHSKTDYTKGSRL